MDRKRFLGVMPLATVARLDADRLGAQKVLGPDAERFIGTYKLISSGGSGENPIGRIHYDRVGRMHVMFHARAREPLPQNATAEDYRESIRGMQAYFGTYTVDEIAKTVTHHMEGALSPNDVGRDRVRWYTFDGNRLNLLTSQTATVPLVWEKLPED